MGWSTKKSLVLSRRILGREIIADIVRLDEGIQLSVYGGEWTHVGAVTVISASGNISTIQFPGHKEAVISETWAEKFYQMFQVPVVCSAGIHYDNLEANEILKITELVEDMLAEGVDTVLSGK